jgi:hypothetical protein
VEAEDEYRIRATHRLEEKHAASLQRMRQATGVLARILQTPVRWHAAACAWALHSWRAALYMAAAGEDFHQLRVRAIALDEQTEGLLAAVDHLRLYETGSLQVRQLTTLHENWKDVVLSELRATEVEVAHAKASLATTALKLRKREDDLVLMLHRFELLEGKHKKLLSDVASASEGSALNAARLQARGSPRQRGPSRTHLTSRPCRRRTMPGRWMRAARRASS